MNPPTNAGRIAAVVLAAGGSSRMGHPKQLASYGRKTLVARAAEAARGAGADPVLVVLGAHADMIRAELAELAGVTTVVNPDWATGLASSLTTGLRAAVDTTCDGVLITLADQPRVDADALGRLIASFRSGSRIVAAGYDGSPGVPALFGREHVPSMLSLTGDTGAGPWLRSRREQVTVVPLDDVLLDVDTPSDLERLAARPGFR